MKTSGLTSRVLIVSLTTLVVGCNDGSPTAPSPAALASSLSMITETAHYVFRHSPDVTVDTNRQERFHEWMAPSSVRLFRGSRITAIATVSRCSN